MYLILMKIEGVKAVRDSNKLRKEINQRTMRKKKNNTEQIFFTCGSIRFYLVWREAIHRI